MRIRSLETVRIEEQANVVWVRLRTDEGLEGLGETFFMPKTVEAFLHEWVAPRIVGRDIVSIDRLLHDLRPYLGGRSAGAETRGASALDIALWDLRGQACGQPIHALLGGAYRDRIRIYNTCAGAEYMRRDKGQGSANWGLGARGPYDDLNGFLERAGDLAQDLRGEGITAMKIWPFDRAAEANEGLHLSSREMAQALTPFERIRGAVGADMDIMVEFHSLWTMAPALKIARELAAFDTYWHEDPLRMENLGDLRRYAEVSKAPICASETLAGLSGFRDLLETGAAGVIMPDLSWCGGISAARKIAVLAEAWRLPVAPHDCTGPVVLCASTHLCLNAPNALIQETVRAYHRGWYEDVVTALPPIVEGHITVPPGPGLGMALHPDLEKRFTVSSLISDERGLRRAL